MKIEITERVMFYDTDCGGVVSNIAYLRFVEKARSALFEAMGMDLASMTTTGLFPAVVRTEVDYLFPARLGDEVRVEATLDTVEKVRVGCRFSLAVGEGEARRNAANALQTIVLVQLPSGRPKRIPTEWLSLVK